MKYKIFKYASSRIDQDGNDNVHYFSKYFAPMFAYFFYKIKFSPNSVTFIFLVTGFLSALLLYWSFPIYAYLAWRLHIILDMADGSLARATKIFSSNAIGFDRSNHIIINTSILLAPLHFNGNIEIANGLIVSFYLYYFFSRNFISDKSTAINFSIKKNIHKYDPKNCNIDSIKEVSSEIYSRIFKPLNLFLLSSIVIFLLMTNYEKKSFKLSQILIFLFGVISVIFFEIITNYSGKSNINMLIFIALPIIIFVVLSLIFYKKNIHKNISK